MVFLQELTQRSDFTECFCLISLYLDFLLRRRLLDPGLDFPTFLSVLPCSASLVVLLFID